MGAWVCGVQSQKSPCDACAQVSRSVSHQADLAVLRVSLRSSADLSTCGVPPVEDHDIAVWILYEAHAANAGVLDSDHFGAGGTRLINSRFDVGDTEGDAILVRDEVLALLLRHPKR